MKTKGYQDNFTKELIVDFFAGGGGSTASSVGAVRPALHFKKDLEIEV